MSDSHKGRRDPDVRFLRRLARDPRERREQELCLLEGIKCVRDHVRSGGTFSHALHSPRLLRSPEGMELDQEIARAADLAGVSYREVSDDALEYAGNATTGQGILLAVPRPDTSGLPTSTGPILVAWEVQDPANVGGLARVAAGAGFSALVVGRSEGGGAADPLSPRALRASAGAALRVPLHEWQGVAAELGLELDRSGYRRIACVAHGGDAPDGLDLTGPIALLLGSEAHGLPGELTAGSTAVTLPLHGELESLNVMAAAAVLAFEAERQRRTGG